MCVVVYQHQDIGHLFMFSSIDYVMAIITTTSIVLEICNDSNIAATPFSLCDVIA